MIVLQIFKESPIYIQNHKIILKVKEISTEFKAGGITFPDFQMHCKATVIKQSIKQC